MAARRRDSWGPRTVCDVSTILHLTDLHLGDRDAHRTSIDDKTSSTAAAHEGTRLTALKETLTALAAGMSSPPDCVVISGDITTADATSGYKRLEEVLDALGAKRPSPDRIAVVPGNHDVDWAANPGRASKYTRFKKYAVGMSYVTPLLEGVHLNADGTARSATAVPNAAPSPILELDDIVVVAVNSSNFCGTRPELTTKQQKFLDSYLDAASDRAAAEADMEKLGVFDMARISTGQLQMLTNELAKVKGDERIRICVLHHQLTPVSDCEEIKPFETITNLGQFREWLVQHRFSVVLHGHKHESALLWDYLPPADDPLGPPVRVLVSAGPSPQYSNDPVGRILELGAVDGRPFVPGAPHARITTFNACRTGGAPTKKIDEVALDRESPQPAADNAFTVIRSASVQDAYEQLRHRVRRAQGHLHNVMCIVDESASATRLPDGYEADKDWLNDTVRWWQLPSSRLVAEGRAPFNHGERLYGGGNPLRAAAKQLGSTKAMVCLVRPDEPTRGAKFPAFVAVQLVQRQTPDGLVVDCVGIFRKQELKHWWPVNMAELHAVQLEVIEHSNETVRPGVGRLISFAVEALDEDVRPQLAGTVLDRHADLAPDRLAELAFYAYLGAPDDAVVGTSELWKGAFADLADAETDEGLPSLGLQELVRYARLLQGYGPTDQGELLRDALKDLLGAASDGARVTDDNPDQSKERRERIARQVKDILDAVVAMPVADGNQ